MSRGFPHRPETSPYRCFLPDLTRFRALRRADPDSTSIIHGGVRNCQRKNPVLRQGLKKNPLKRRISCRHSRLPSPVVRYTLFSLWKPRTNRSRHVSERKNICADRVSHPGIHSLSGCFFSYREISETVCRLRSRPAEICSGNHLDSNTFSGCSHFGNLVHYAYEAHDENGRG